MTGENSFRSSGVLMLVVVSTSLVSGILAGIYGVELNAFDVETTLANVGSNSGEHVLGLIVETVSSIVTVALAGVLYLAFKDLNRVQAIIGSLWLSASGIIIAVHDLGNFALAWIAGDYAIAAGSQQLAIASIARSMLLTGKWGVTVGSTFLLLGIFAYSLILISRFSKSIGWFGIVASALGFFAAWIGWIDPSLQYVGFALFLPLIIWEFTFGIWLLRQRGRVASPSSS